MFSFSQLPADRPRLMGIVNVTPDSFSDGNLFLAPPTAAAHARALAAAGACILDLGAESSSFFRPGIAPIPPDEQLRRLLPVLQLLKDPPLPAHVALSIDTRSAHVAGAILTTQIENRKSKIENPILINDISAGTHDPAMLDTVAAHHAAIILMHITPGYPATPPADDPDILATVRDYLERRAAAARAAGIALDRIALDPGIGFGKTMPDNWRLALRAHELSSEFPIVLGASRKRFLDTPVPPDVALPPAWPNVLAQLQSHLTPNPNLTLTLNLTRNPNPRTPIENQKSKIENPLSPIPDSQFPITPHPRDPASVALALLAAPRAIHRLHNVALSAYAARTLRP